MLGEISMDGGEGISDGRLGIVIGVGSLVRACAGDWGLCSGR